MENNRAVYIILRKITLESVQMLVFLAVLFISILVFICYVNFRVITKFDNTIKFWETLIPVWNTYILAKQVMSKPGLYTSGIFIIGLVSVFVMMQILGWSFPTEKTMTQLHNYRWFFDLLKIIYAILTAYLWGEVAQALGKNRWLHRVMAFLSLPLIITVPIMAFDSSQPVKKSQE